MSPPPLNFNDIHNFHIAINIAVANTQQVDCDYFILTFTFLYSEDSMIS